MERIISDQGSLSCQLCQSAVSYTHLDVYKRQLLGKVDNLILLIYNKVTGLDNFLTHDGCHLSHLMAGFSTLQLLCKDIANLIQLGGFTTLTLSLIHIL